MSFLFFLLFLGFLIFGAYKTLVFTTTKNEYGRRHINVSIRLLHGLMGFIPAVLFLFMFMSYTQIASGFVGVVYRNGRAVRTIEAGPHLLIPFVESSGPVCTKTLVVKPTEGGSSNDLQIVTTQVTLAYHFDPSYAMYFATQLIDSNDNAVENKVVFPAIIEAVKAVTAQYTAQDLIQKRAEVRDRIDSFVKARLDQYHIITETVSITDFAFSKEFNEAIEAKVTAKQNAEKADNDLQRIKIEAEQKIAQAQGEAQALRSQKEQITPELLQLRTIEMLNNKWDGHLPENYYGGSSPLPIVDVLKKR